MRSHRALGAAAGALLALLGACTSTSTAPSEAGQARLLLVKPAVAILEGGRSLRLQILLVDDERVTQAPAGVIWSSSDAHVATVAAEGLVQGGREGSADIVASWNGLRGVARLTVVDGVARQEPCPTLSVAATGPRHERPTVCPKPPERGL